MATAYTEFTCLGQDLLTTLQTAILASTDWARPNAAGKPTLYKATTTRGAQMVVDLADSALVTNQFTLGVYRTHDGTTGVDKINRYILPLNASRGTLAANTYRGTVSAGKEHIYISVEGPRGSEVNADNSTYGSMRTYFFMSDIVPYFDAVADPIPAVAVGGWYTNQVSSGFVGVNNHVTVVSRNAANTSSWLTGKLLTLTFPLHNYAVQPGWQTVGPDGNQYLAPYVFFDDVTGIRGRLSSFFFAGWSQANDSYETPGVSPGPLVTYGGKQYKLVAPSKSDSSRAVWGQFGAVNNNNGTDMFRSPVIAVPYN